MYDHPLLVCLVTEEAQVEQAVRLACPPPHEVRVFAPDALLDERQQLSERGRELVAGLRKVDVVLVHWEAMRAARLQALCHHIRRAAPVPLLALCAGGGQDEMIAALASGVDDVASFPLYLPLLQARAAAYRRLIRSVRRATARRIRKRLQRLEEQAATAPETLLPAPGRTGGRPSSPPDRKPASPPEPPPPEHAREIVGAVAREIEDALAPVPPESGNPSVLVCGPLRLDVDGFRFFIHEREVELTPKEFDLLHYLMQHPGEVCSRDQILDAVWGLNFDTGTNMVDVYMHFVRRKLAEQGLKGVIQTVRGRGYRLQVSRHAT
ncbi:MAG: hypothetical protein KatS3mg043_1576 [Rhodothermaceae bacterium]|nr:MAG: hypothetical protein KatS3mg043_1576 [Rhodothermaceae bacterium]